MQDPEYRLPLTSGESFYKAGAADVSYLRGPIRFSSSHCFTLPILISLIYI